MERYPKVSILIPVYNREKYILETLCSATQQEYSNTEIIVVDNNSTDTTFDLIQKFAKTHSNVKVYQNSQNMGPVKNWKQCLNYATGEYVKILFSDDLIASDYLNKTIPYIVKQKDVGFVYSGVKVFKDKPATGQPYYFIGDTNIYSSKNFINGVLFKNGFPASPSCALFRRTDMEQNLLLNIPNRINIDLSLKGAGNDSLIFLLTANQYPKFAFVNEPLSFFRDHRDSITISTSKADLRTLYYIANAYFIEKHLKNDYIKRKYSLKLFKFTQKYTNTYGIKTYKDFYPQDANVKINCLPLVFNVLKNLFKKIAK